MRRRTRRATTVGALAVAALVALVSCTSAPSAADSLVVRTDKGLVRGVQQGKVTSFSGIRYAAAPSGPLRWRAPQPPRPWQDTVDASKPGHICPQQPIPGSPSPAEDCLTVNVMAPANAKGKRLPVMLWWHGGGYFRDSGSQYGARRMVERGQVIVVTANYRLGAFGYFGQRGLPGSGTFGLADQIASLRWVKRNAAAFGGNPDNVTVFGQSAGSMSTCAALTSPATEGLIDKAIMSSGSCELRWPRGTVFPKAPEQAPYAPLQANYLVSKQFAAKAGCGKANDALACLRSKPSSALQRFNMDFGNQLAYGTPLLPKAPAAAVRAGEFHRVPVIAGATRYEQRAQIGGAAQLEPITAKRYPSLLRDSFGDRAAEVAARYPLRDYRSAVAAWAVLTTDASWSCGLQATNEDMARRAPVYAYEFADEKSPNVNNLHVPGLPQGAAHATDLPYLFALNGTELPLSPAQQRMSSQMIDYWTTFAKTGDPNSEGAPRWERFTGDGPTLALRPDWIGEDDFVARHHCALWRTFS